MEGTRVISESSPTHCGPMGVRDGRDEGIQGRCLDQKTLRFVFRPYHRNANGFH